MQRFTSQKKMKILTFSTRRQNSLNGVLDETTTANTRGWNSCAHARLGKFTSGSRPSSSRRPILRSLICFVLWLLNHLFILLVTFGYDRQDYNFVCSENKQAIYFFLCYVEKSETKQNYRLGKAEFYILDRAVENMSNKRKLNNF